MNQCGCLYLLSLLYLFNQIIGFNATENNYQGNSVLQLKADIRTLYGSLICILFGIVSMVFFAYYRQNHKNKLTPVLNQIPSVEKQMIRNLNDLSSLKPIKPFALYFIHRTQVQFILDDFLIQTEKTKLFTLISKRIPHRSKCLFLHIELVQDLHTIIALIEYHPEKDRNSDYFWIIRNFFAIIFDPSKTIQTWGNLFYEMKDYTLDGLFRCSDIAQAQSVDIQKQFKLWYNSIFRHNVQCHHYLKYDEIDGSLCSCAHRPYKSSSCQWSISKAMAYTFDERFDSYPYQIHHCLAITKLAHVINEKWTFEDLKAFKKTQL